MNFESTSSLSNPFRGRGRKSQCSATVPPQCPWVKVYRSRCYSPQSSLVHLTIPITALLSAPLLSTAVPLFGLGGGGGDPITTAATATLTRRPLHDYRLSSVASSALSVSTRALASVTNLLNTWRQLFSGNLANNASSLVRTVNQIQRQPPEFPSTGELVASVEYRPSIGAGGSASSSSNGVISKPLVPTSLARSASNSAGSIISSAVSAPSSVLSSALPNLLTALTNDHGGITAFVDGLQTLVSNLGSGLSSSLTDISTTLQSTLGQLTTGVNSVTTGLTNLSGSDSFANETQLAKETQLQTLASAVKALLTQLQTTVPNLQSQAPR
ncbi:hypothetical protein DFH07DRAFT_1056263 [Mycena maculata]|uniref:Uncharacterized protein n=1 Tax=Mycena maculata TaxID=230809 RepID=A0AAD7K462_9AGAR|nr:hypothetical protein DFH07DRAFT_1056263 [Mycena maculata]